MAMNDFYNYKAYLELMDKQLAIWGQRCRVYCPSSSISLGYENMTENESENKMDVNNVGNKYSSFDTIVFVNFNTPKSVFYKFNYFPKNEEELTTAFFKTSSKIRENCYIRTAVPEQTSIWGDLMFKVQKIEDSGMYNTLKRTYFLVPTANADLHFTLDF